MPFYNQCSIIIFLKDKYFKIYTSDEIAKTIIRNFIFMLKDKDAILPYLQELKNKLDSPGYYQTENGIYEYNLHMYEYNQDNLNELIFNANAVIIDLSEKEIYMADRPEDLYELNLEKYFYDKHMVDNYGEALGFVSLQNQKITDMVLFDDLNRTNRKIYNFILMRYYQRSFLTNAQEKPKSYTWIEKRMAISFVEFLKYKMKKIGYKNWTITSVWLDKGENKILPWIKMIEKMTDNNKLILGWMKKTKYEGLGSTQEILDKHIVQQEIKIEQKEISFLIPPKEENISVIVKKNRNRI